jgi:lysophospholipase L1-like esterase
MHEINAWIAAQAARDPNVFAVDTRTAAAARDDGDRLAASPDGLHPDVEGYRAMAEAIMPGVMRALARQ